MSSRNKNAFRPTLSKNLLEMKFMQRSKSKVENEKFEHGNKRHLEDVLKEPIDKNGIVCVMENSFVPCEDLLFGRMSFKGQNPEIEKIMREYEAMRAEKAIDEAEAKGSISAEEMADRYSTLIGTVGKKFEGKRKRDTDEKNSKLKDKTANKKKIRS